MPVANLRPLATGAYNAWTLTAGATKVAAVDAGDPLSHDDLTSYLEEGSNVAGTKQSFTLTNKPVIVTLNSVVQGVRARGNSANELAFFIRLSSVDGANNVVSPAGPTFNTLTLTALRPGGGSFTAADIADSTLEMAISRFAPTGVNIGVTSMWVAVDYQSSSAGLIVLIAQWIGPVVAVGWHEIPKIAAEIYRRSRGEIRIKRDEFKQLYLALKSARYPAYFDMRS